MAESRSLEIEDPKTKKKFWILARPNAKTEIFPILPNGEPDYKNPITDKRNIPIAIRPEAQSQILRMEKNIAADLAHEEERRIQIEARKKA